MKKFPFAPAGLCALLLSAALAIPAGASTFLYMDDIDLVAAADAIVVAEVVEQHSFWNQGATLIVTDTRLVVRDVITGDAPAELTVRTIGGELGSERIVSFGEPAFERGQVQLLMLQVASDDTLRVAGYRQGQHRILEREDGVEVALPMIDGAHFITLDGRPVPKSRALPLETLKTHLRTVRAELDALTRPATR